MTQGRGQDAECDVARRARRPRHGLALRLRRRAARAAFTLACLGAGLLMPPSLHEADAAPATSAKSVTIRQFSPQGEVATVRQARAVFSDAMVAFGDAGLAAPFDVRCAAPGTGRWVDDRSWVYDFTAAVGPGARCSFALKSEVRSHTGAAVAGKTSFTFSTGGPAIVRNFPSAGEGGAGIDEEQVFVLVLNGPATPASVQENAWCEISGIGERVGVRLVDGPDRGELIKRFSLASRADNVTMLSCARRLPNGAQVALVWGRGIASASGIVTTVERRLKFEVRPDFTASFTCERENAQAGCTPVRPVRVELTSPVARATAERFVLRFSAAGRTVERRPFFDADNRSASTSQIEFRPPFAENAELVVEAPKDLVDDAGRPLSNGSLFPLKSRTAVAPPLAKFAAAPFGILELNADPVLPLTVRHVEAALAIKDVTVTGGPVEGGGQSQGIVRSTKVDAGQGDAAIVAWQRRIKRYHESTIPRDQVAPADLPPDLKAAAGREGVGRRQRPPQQAASDARDDTDVATRELSLLARDPAAKTVALPDARSGDPRPFEVVGIPLPQPGFHVVEVESQRLGAALLGKPAPMYVRTTALVTNLGVHAKFGRVNAGVWVTTLDRAKPVPGAVVQISDCVGKPLWNGTTDARGFAFVGQALPPLDYTRCRRGPRAGDATGDGEATDDEYGDGGEVGYFVSARKAIAEGPNTGATDMAFVWSNWNEGIESWRFNVSGIGGDDGGAGAGADRIVAHTVFDRTLLRAGQTVSMKHFVRLEKLATLAWPDAAALPATVDIVHVGSGQKYSFDLAWRSNRYAETAFTLPDDAKLGVYQVALRRGARTFETGTFRVEEFRLPVMRGRIEVVASDGAKAPRGFVRPPSLSAGVSIAYTNGGSAAALPVRLSAAIRPHFVQFAGYDGYSFVRAERSDDDGDVSYADFVDDGPRSSRGAPGPRVIADKLAVTLDKDGAGRVVLKDLLPIDAPRDLLVEATYPDPNGEIQTLSQTVALWPAAVTVGIRADDWVSVRGKSDVKMVVVDTGGKPVSGAAVEVHGIAHTVRSIRKRMVGGFYAYDNQRESKELGLLCSGKSNAQGLVSCAVALAEAGNVELVATAKDAAGNAAHASASVWVTRQAEVWFGGENQDRIDVLPEKKSYAPGEMARFQVRMPFRAATALVAIERDGILATQVVEIRGDDPTIAVKVEADWAPNVFVSVLAVRGRIRDVPWYSFFTWGWKSPADWWRAWRDEGKLYEPPTALVDLGKPSFKFGIASIQVDKAAHLLKVSVTTDKPDYAVRATAMATVRVTLPDGKPVPAGTEVALAAVDEALLELMPNVSWDLFDAMIRQRGYAIETATAQMQIIGKRHYGRKAAPAGGGGGVSPSRELFDTLLVWKPSVVLDASGSATVDVPLNDALTAFRIVAIADSGTALFGTGSATIRSRQDLQIVTGLPPLVRAGDRYQAGITLRNTTKTAMDVEVAASTVVASADAGGDRSATASASGTAAAKDTAPGKGTTKAAATGTATAKTGATATAKTGATAKGTDIDNATDKATATDEAKAKVKTTDTARDKATAKAMATAMATGAGAAAKADAAPPAGSSNAVAVAVDAAVAAPGATGVSPMQPGADTATRVAVAPSSAVELPRQRVLLEPDASQGVEWSVTAPDQAGSIAWRFDAKSVTAAIVASDSVTVPQRVAAAVPVTVQQATLARLDRRFKVPVAPPADAMPDASGAPRGGLVVALKSTLADGLPGVRDWFARYPYACLEQKASIAIGTLDEAKWNEVARQIPLYLDGDGLASYFPPRADERASGSDVLTAYLLTASAEANALGRFTIPDATRARMEAGLVAFVDGRLKRDLWTPFATDGQRQLDVRKLAAIEALGRGGKAVPRMLQSIQVLPNQWPTSALIDWLLILKRLPAIPDRTARVAEVDQILRARLNYQGTRLDFSTEKDDFWYWLMASGDGNASRLLMAVLDDPAWKDDVPRLVTGSLQRQTRGHWLTTTANVWGTLAVNQFSRRFERDPVTGVSRAAVDGGTSRTLVWADQPTGADLRLPWPAVAAEAVAAAASRHDLEVTHDGTGKPWMTIQSLAAVALKAPFTSGYRITRTIEPVEQKTAGSFTRGDVLRVKVEVDAQTDMSWVVLSDPVPGGATILGTGLGRDSQLASTGERSRGWASPVYEEKGFESYRGYYRFVPKGKFSVEYTVRLNNVGTFNLPPTRVEAMYAPEMYGAVPNAAIEVKP